MNKAVVAALVGVVGLALGFGAAWLWDTANGDASPAESPGASTSPTAAASS